MHSRFHVTDKNEPGNSNEANRSFTLPLPQDMKRLCCHYQPDWDDHPLCRLCRSRHYKGAEDCSKDQPCGSVLSGQMSNGRNLKTIQRKITKDKKKKIYGYGKE